ncbi:photosynthetic reaction center subunit H [Glacieibacterium sp.]|uniref:photosynthetic reaction center subunit H n=1 Tax=Glacieibacterium sp. TaxID=2860237 RepID=UPI003B0076D7
MSVHLTPGLDVAELCVWAFFIFFIGLVIWLRREDRREGYPLEEDVGGRIHSPGGFLEMALPKTFRLPFDHGIVTAPNPDDRDPYKVSARRTAPWDGSPLEPLGNPLSAGVGPGSYARRAQRPDVNMEGHARIIPMQSAPDFHIATRDPDPRGFTVVGADRVIAGTVEDLWIDTADRLVRYLEVKLPDGRNVLTPMMMSVVDRKRRTIICDAILGRQFDGAPSIARNDQITLDEEERVQAYFGAGYLYATPERAEPIL